MDIQSNLRRNGASCITTKSKSEIIYLNNLLYNEVDDICEYLKNKYLCNMPLLEIVHINRMTNRDAYEKLRLDNNDMRLYQGYIDYPNYGIKPDGGIILLNHYNKEDDIVKTDIIFASELKRQGSNDKRLIEGKPKQAIGNAIERLGKNAKFISNLTENEDIYPYMIFVSGCDVNEPFFLSKLIQSNNGRNINTYNLYKENNQSCITFITQEENFDSKTFRKYCIQMAEDSLLYYLKKSQYINNQNYGDKSNNYLENQG